MKPISLYIADFLAAADAARLFAALNQLAWRQHVIPMWGKQIPAPRLYQWMGVPPQDRAYSHGAFKTEGGIYAGETCDPKPTYRLARILRHVLCSRPRIRSPEQWGAWPPNPQRSTELIPSTARGAVLRSR
jgi:hypothetical protein